MLTTDHTMSSPGVGILVRRCGYVWKTCCPPHKVCVRSCFSVVQLGYVHVVPQSHTVIRGGSRWLRCMPIVSHVYMYVRMGSAIDTVIYMQLCYSTCSYTFGSLLYVVLQIQYMQLCVWLIIMRGVMFSQRPSMLLIHTCLIAMVTTAYPSAGC